MLPLPDRVMALAIRVSVAKPYPKKSQKIVKLKESSAAFKEF